MMITKMPFESSNVPPPVYERAREIFGKHIDFNKGAIFTYGNTIHYADSTRLTPDLIAHELVHVKQQTAMGAVEWWERYFIDDEFRLKEELEAYNEQYRYVVQWYPRAKHRAMLRFFAACLCNNYGIEMELSDAMNLIKGV